MTISGDKVDKDGEVCGRRQREKKESHRKEPLPKANGYFQTHNLYKKVNFQ